MASSEERMKILKMIEEGKLSAEEGTKLLAALSDKRMSAPPRPPGLPGGPRWLRIRVTDVLDLLANGLTTEQVLEELPDLELEDIHACLRFASQRLNHPVVVA